MGLEDFFWEQIKQNLLFDLTDDQLSAIDSIVQFLFTPLNDSVFLLKGYAGTGKSSLIGALVKTMTSMNQKTVLMAPTGRAAKVFGAYANHMAYTIHKKIYRQKKYTGDLAGFVSIDNLYKDTLFIVDEASMISNGDDGASSFGSGRLLDDLIHYVYGGENCRLLLVGDEAQLAPVMQEYSPALNISVLKGYGLDVISTQMTMTVRQSTDSGILYNATSIRKILAQGGVSDYPKLKIKGFNDIKQINGSELIEELDAAYNKYGIDNTIVISRSNKRANIYNEGIRNRVLYREEEISAGDLLMVTKNNYFWTEKIEQIDFLANGELLQVLRVRRIEEIYGFRFCDVLVRHPDYDIEIEIKILLDTLISDSTSLSREKTSEMFYNILEDYNDLSKNARIQKMKTDLFFNAVQVKYGYAVTCHKAQGGEWLSVFLDIGFVSEEYLGENFYRWIYTAITRASQNLFFVNLPEQFLQEN